MLWLISLLFGLIVGTLLGSVFTALARADRERELEIQIQNMKSKQQPVDLRVWIHEDKQHRARIFSGARVEPHKVINVLAMTYDGKTFSEAGMSGVVSKREFRLIRDWLLTSGFAYWKNPRAHAQGVNFNARGNALLRAANDWYSSPCPTPTRTPAQTNTPRVRGRACVRGRAIQES